MPTARFFVSLVAAASLLLPPLTAGATGPGRPAPNAPGITEIRPLPAAPAPAVLPERKPLQLKGWVTDSNNRPLPGATVWLTGSHQLVVVAGVTGEFQLTLPDDSPVTLTVGYGGYTEEIVKLNHPRTQNGLLVELKPVASKRL